MLKEFYLKYLWIFVSIIFPLSAIAQQQDDNFQSVFENLAEENEEASEDDELWQQLLLCQNHPLNINQAASEDFKIFFFLTPLQIESFIQYRKFLGRFISIYELQAIPQWDIPTIKRLLPYIYLSSDPFEKSYRFRDYFNHGNTEMVFRFKRDIEKKKGFIKKDSISDPHYLGDPNNLLLRIRYRFSNNFSTGITADKDAGEPFKRYGQRGFDFYSAHFFIKDYKKINALAIGDYRINFGQGLINKQGLIFGKSSMVMNVDQSEYIISPHTSPMEYGFYRGVAISIGKKKINMTLFISSAPEDASLKQTDSTLFYFNGFQKSGYHRSLTELKNKGSVNLFSSGGSLRYNFNKGHLSLNSVFHHFSDSMKSSNQLYDLYGFMGKDMWNVSMDYSLFLRQLYFFGETAASQTGALATMNGVMMSVDPKADISLLYRNYSASYTSLYARSFGENAEPQNEKGFYTGIILRPVHTWQIDAFADIFNFPWLKYRLDAPSNGKEYFIQATYTPSKKYTSYFRYRFKQKYLNELETEPFASVISTRKQSFRLHNEWKYSDHFTFRNITEVSLFRKERLASGYFLAQDILWKANRLFSGNVRVGWFQTDNFDTRIYAYENDVRYAYSIPFLYGNGLRGYANLRMNIGKRISIWSKFSRTLYYNQQTIGSGYDEIQGNKRTAITTEIIYDLK